MVTELPLHTGSLAFCMVTSPAGRMVHLGFTSALCGYTCFHSRIYQHQLLPLQGSERVLPFGTGEHKDKFLAKEETMRTELKL